MSGNCGTCAHWAFEWPDWDGYHRCLMFEDIGTIKKTELARLDVDPTGISMFWPGPDSGCVLHESRPVGEEDA